MIRSMLCDSSAHAEVVPVDFAINGLIMISFEFATMKEKPKEVSVYNVTIPPQYRYSWGFLLDTGRKVILDYPFEAGIWFPGGDITTNKLVHYLRVFFTQWLPAYFVDALCLLIGRDRL